MIRVVGADPGTSSLDLLLLEEGRPVDQVRLEPAQLKTHPDSIRDVLGRWGALDLVAAPSGYGLPLVRGEDFREDHLEQMSLVRPEDRNRDAGVIGFRAWVRAFLASGQPLVFLPGGFHLPTIPSHRKAGAIDLGTADKVATAALARALAGPGRGSTFALAEIGSAFSSILVLEHGRIVDACSGTHGPLGLRAQGAWDGEVAYWTWPLRKEALFRGGVRDLGPAGPEAFRESLRKAAAGLQSITPFERIVLAGRGLEDPAVADLVTAALAGLGTLEPLGSLPGAWVKHAAQGAAILADGLAGGRHAPVVDQMELRSASGSVWDVLTRPAHPIA